MKYFLDFDRTVFDTDAFKKSVAQHPTVLELFRQFTVVLGEFFKHDPITSRRRRFMRTWGTFLSHGRFFFTPEEIKHFLYPEVPEFLESHDCTIVTYGVWAFITAKVATALTDLKLTDIVYTSRKKGRTIQRLSKEAKEECTFVDDMPFQLASVQAWCPEVRIIEIRRDGGPGDGRFRVIHSLSELE